MYVFCAFLCSRETKKFVSAFIVIESSIFSTEVGSYELSSVILLATEKKSGIEKTDCLVE